LGYLPGTVSEPDGALLTRSAGVTHFVTQDRGRLDQQGRLLVEGRLDSLRKRRGVFVDVARMAEVAMSVAGVTSACAVQIDPDASGQVVLAVEGEMSLPDLRGALRRHLGTEVPDDIVVVERLPLLPNGKLDGQQVGRLALTARSRP
jgi:acyl-CoA synthetase (AMP-forming)/AMP-acid ligase II